MLNEKPEWLEEATGTPGEESAEAIATKVSAVAARIQEAESKAKPFHFKFEADDNGLVGISFLKDVSKVHWVFLELGSHVNRSFTEPFPTVGDFFRHLGEVADDYDRMIYERTQANDGERSSEEVRTEETGGGVCSADGDLRTECDQGRVPETRH